MPSFVCSTPTRMRAAELSVPGSDLPKHVRQRRFRDRQMGYWMGMWTATAAPLSNGPTKALGRRRTMATLLWILAVILVIAGIFAIVRKQLLWGIVLIVVGLLVGPGGVSIFT